jgi:hypothetical protein
VRVNLSVLWGALILTTGVEAAQPAYRWHNVTIGGGGFSPGIIFSRAERNLAYLRTDIGGIYRWDHPTQTWVPLQDTFSEGNYFGIESIALDPHDPQIVYAAVGMYHTSPAAIIRSTNRGSTWTVYPVGFRMGGNEKGRGVGERLGIDPNKSDLLYFGSRYDGLQRSADRGQTWAKVPSFPYAGLGVSSSRRTSYTGLSFVVFDPRGSAPGQPSRTLFVGVADPSEHHLFRSDDAGTTWYAVPDQPDRELLPVQAQLDDQGILYIAYSNTSGPNGATDGAVYKLDTATSRWTNITPDRSAPGGYMGLSLDRQRRDTLIVASLNRWNPGDVLWRTTDGGKTWTDLTQLSTRDVHVSPFLTWGEPQASFGWWMAGVAVDPFESAHVAYTTGATIYATHQVGSPGSSIPWQPWVRGIEETAVITLTSPTAGPELLSGFGDIGGYAHEDFQVSPPMFSHPSFDNTNTVDYAARANVVVRSGTPHSNNGNQNAPIAWSDDYGKKWRPIAAPVPQLSGEPQTSPRDPKGDPPIITSADGQVFVLMTPVPLLSRDRGQHWRPLRELPPSTRVVADRQDPQRLYALDFQNASLWSSTDAGATFKPLTSVGLPPTLHDDEPRNPEVPVPLLAVPNRSGDLWLISQGRLFHSLDGGNSFLAVPNDLSIARLSFGKPAPGRDYPTLYAIATLGDLVAIWRSEDRGTTWIRINDAEHEYGRRFRCIAGDMRIYGRVYVGTDGRGIIYGDSAE